MKGKLIIEPCAGLGNRILAFVSARYVAEMKYLDFFVVWKKEGPCYASYSDLFEKTNGFHVVEITEMQRRDIKDWVPTIIGWGIKHKLRKNRVFITSGECRKLIQKRYFDSMDVEKEYYIKSVRPLISVTSFPLSQYVPGPSEKVIRSGEEVWKLIRNNTIGVHIRRTDHLSAIEGSPTDSFIQMMYAEIEKNENTNFFICSDDVNEIDRLSREFGDKIFYNKVKNKTRLTRQGMVDAAVDMWGLSKCKKIIGSKESTFSEVASLIGDVPLVIASKNSFK